MLTLMSWFQFSTCQPRKALSRILRLYCCHSQAAPGGDQQLNWNANPTVLVISSSISIVALRPTRGAPLAKTKKFELLFRPSGEGVTKGCGVGAALTSEASSPPSSLSPVHCPPTPPKLALSVLPGPR